MEEYVDVRVFIEEKIEKVGNGYKEVEGVSVSKNSKVGNIKKYFLERYPEFTVRFFPNKDLEVRNIFSHAVSSYDNHDLSSIFEKVKDPFIILFPSFLSSQNINQSQNKNIGINRGRIRIAQQAKGRSYPVVKGFENIPAWSRGKGEWKELSPFFIRIPKYKELREIEGEVKETVYHNVIFESFWQSFKVWEKVDKQNGKDWKWPAEIHVKKEKEEQNPNENWWNWHSALLKHEEAVRRPNGRAIPLYSYYRGQKLGVVEARKQIYIPWLQELYRKNEVYQKLLQMVKSGINVMIIEPDGPLLDFYDEGLEVNLQMLYNLINVTNYAPEGYPHKYRPYGHGYVIALTLLQDTL